MNVTRRDALLYAGGTCLAAATGVTGVASAASGPTSTNDQPLATTWEETLDGDERIVRNVVATDDGVAVVSSDRTWAGDDGFRYNGRVEFLTADGELEWEFTLQDDGYDYDPWDLVPWSDGVLVLGARTPADETGSSDALLVSLDENGEERWREVHDWHERDTFFDGALIADDELLVAGQSYDDAGDRNVVLWSLDPDDGSRIERTELEFEGSRDSLMSPHPAGVVASEDGAVVLANVDSAPTTDEHATLLEVGPGLQELWREQLGSPGSDYFRSLASDGDDGFLAVGVTTDDGSAPGDGTDGVVVATDADGEEHWRTRIETEDTLELRDATSVGEAVLAVGHEGLVPGTGARGFRLAGADGDWHENDGTHEEDVDGWTAAATIDDESAAVAGPTWDGLGLVRGLRYNEPPVAEIAASPAQVTVGESVTFDASDSTDVIGIEAYAWDVGKTGEFEPGDATKEVSFDEPGTHEVVVRVTDVLGESVEAATTVEVDPEEEDDGSGDGDDETGDSGDDGSGEDSDGDDGDALPGFGVGLAGASALATAALARFATAGDGDGDER